MKLSDITTEQQELARRLFVAREEIRASDMQRYGANVYAPTDMEEIIIELFGGEREERLPLITPGMENDVPF